MLKKRSSILTCHCHLAPHHCGSQEVYQVNGLMYVDSLNRQFPKPTVKSAIMEPSRSPVARWVSKDQSFHHQVWIHLLHVNARLVDRVSRDDKHRRPLSRKRNSPYDHSKEGRQHQQHATTCVCDTCHPCDNTRLSLIRLFVLPLAPFMRFHQRQGCSVRAFIE